MLFHIATAILLYLLFKRFFKEYIAFLFSLIFLVHPALVEAVCFASALQEILFTFIGVLGLYILVIPAEAGIQPQNLNLITIFVEIILFSLSLLMKETGIVFFALGFWYLLIFHRKNIQIVLLYCAFSIIIIFTYALIRLGGGNIYVQGLGLFPIMRVPLLTRLITIPMIILYYVSTFLFPFHLGIAQHWVIQSIDFWYFWSPLASVIGFLLLLIFLQIKNHSRSFLFFFFWFLIGLLPHLQLIPLNMTVAERWLYFPMIGLLGMMGSMVDELKIKNLKLKIAGILIVSLFFVRSFTRTLDWRNGLALYGSTITRTSSFDLQNNMGVELFRIGKYQQAKQYFEASTRLAPYWWVNWNNLGAAYEREGNIKKAQKYYEQSIKNGRYILAYENYAKILVSQERDSKKTKEFIKKALHLFPESDTLNKLYLYEH